MRAARLCCALLALLPAALPHSVTIRPMSRNSVDRDLPLFADGSFPLGDKGHYGLPGTAANGTDAGIGQCNESTWLEFKTASCLGGWCSNGTQPCRGAQSCYWFSQGCWPRTRACWRTEEVLSRSGVWRATRSVDFTPSIGRHQFMCGLWPRLTVVRSFA